MSDAWLFLPSASTTDATELGNGRGTWGGGGERGPIQLAFLFQCQAESTLGLTENDFVAGLSLIRTFSKEV